MRELLLSVLATVVLAAPAQPATESTVTPDSARLEDLPPGLWSAELESPGGPLAFGLQLSEDADGWSAWLVNGEERIPVPQVSWDGRRLNLEIPHYDSRLAASAITVEGVAQLRGLWTKRTGRDSFARLPFRATPPSAPIDVAPGDGVGAGAGTGTGTGTGTGAGSGTGTGTGTGAATGTGSATATATPATATQNITGRWRVQFESDGQPAVGVFEQSGDSLRGTFLTTTGDYRYLAGTVSDGVYRLSCFDGAHAFLFEAQLSEDGSLSGDFWSRDVWHETWTAVRDEQIQLPDGFQLTHWTGAAELSALSYPDVTGTLRSLDDPAFAGHARILQVFGSWCPNCHDASEFMVDLHRRYGPRGLSIVGLAFEVTGDFRRDAQQVLAYAERHDVGYPLLVAGLSDKAAAGKAFPLLDQVRSYPTTIFLHADGRVRAIYQGFSGPATGQAYDVLRASFEAIIEELLAEGEAAAAAPSDG